MSNIIEVNQLVKRYPGSEQPAVRGVSFAVRRGEIFGLLGPIGAGKTTLLAMLSGLLKASSGSATIAGFDLARHSKDIKRLVKFVPQKLTVCPLLSTKDNLLWYGRLHGINCKQLKPRITEVLKLVGLDCCRGADKQARGTQRRISFAATLLHQPEILVLDEPTLNVDPQSRCCLWDAVAELNRRGVTVLVATRDGEEAARLCHRVALINQGRIVALDTPPALLALLRGGCAARENLDAVFAELTGKHLRG
jgi:ABC-2 type transport system ATP-binding protein